MSDYQRDAHVIEIAESVAEGGHSFNPKNHSHAIAVDILEGESFSRNILFTIQGQKNAEREAAMLNKWRDQTKFTQ